jgi:pentatricopeptide repeat protein
MPDSPITGESVLIRAFAALDRKVYGRWQRLAYPIELKHDPHTLELASKIGEGVFDDKQGQSVDGDRMMLNWMALSEQTRDSGWHFLLLYLLDRRPALALSFVQVLAHEPVTTPLRSEMLADALEHIARSSIHRKRMGRRDVNRSVLVPTFSQVFREHLAKFPKICSQDLLWNIGRLSSQDDLRHVFDLLVEHKAYIGYDTLLHFANIFADFGDHKYALRCMSRIVHSISSSAAAQDVIKRERFLWSCALILRRSTSKGQNYHATTEIVADFLKLGVKLDILLYNVIMHNAMEASDHATAFRVYNVLEDNGLSPNKHTYSILLHGCTVSNDPGRFQDFAEHCKRKAVELKNPWLAAEYLYYVYVQHHEDDPAHLSERLRYSYSQFFSIDSVAPFYPSLSRSSLDQRSSLTDQQGDDAGQMEPPPLAIYLVLQAEIRRSLAISNTHVWDLYLQFRHLVTGSSYPALKKLAEAPIIWNAFLLAFCKNKQFANASYLIKGMTDSPNSSVPQPNVYSWNIFMQAFFKNEQIRAAERIYEIMRARGIESDQFTYGVMLRGYARAQHSEKVGEVMGNMENEQQLDPSVLQALTRVHDRKRLMFALEQSRLAKEKEEEKKADAIEADERKRWAFPRLKSKLSSHRLSAPEVKQLSDESESQHIAPLEAPTEKLETSLEPEGTPTVTLAQPEPNGQLRH